MVQVTVKLFATLRNNREKEMTMDLGPNATPKDIIEHLNIAQEEAAIIMINGRCAKFDTVLKDHDIVSIFPPVGGG